MMDEFLSLLHSSDEMESFRSEYGSIDSPMALLSQHVELEALLEAGLDLDFHSPEYAKFRMEAGMQPENVEATSPCKAYSLDSDADSIFDISEFVNEDDAELEAIVVAAEAELQKATQVLQSRARAKSLENEETKALMQEWSLNDEAFEAPPRVPSPDLTIVAPPPLADGMGPVLHIRNGGSLRSMSPSHFRGEDLAGQLVMQVSNPVVVPSEMGATSMAILRRMAMAGMEGMGAQAMKHMPLEDLTGKGVDQLLVENLGAETPGDHGYAALGYGERYAINVREKSSCRKDGGRRVNLSDEYMGVDELAPMAMARIEALALEGIKIQAEMTDQRAPCVVEALASERSHHMRSGYIADHGAEDDSPMNMAVSLDEWMRLDAGVCGENETEEQTLAIMAAHNGNKRDVVVSKKQDRRSNSSTGYMGDTITLAMLVQLRDPLRCNEPVGAPMMALVQAERVMVPPKPKLSRRITSLPGKRTSNEEENDNQPQVKQRPQFKIVGVTVAGLNTNQTSPAARKPEVGWGSRKQLQAGSRWLTAQGMQKATKAHPALKGKAAAPQVKVQPGDSLWSISAKVHGSGSKWKDIARLNPHIRNPDIIFPDTSIRTH